jgi:xyloglucan fucosyltransferase
MTYIPVNLTADHLLDGLLTADFSYRSCRSRYEFASYHKNSSHKPSPYLLSKLRKQEALQKRCGPGTAAYKKALRRLQSGDSAAGTGLEDGDDCRYLVNISFRGLGNRMLAVASAFLYAVLTERVLLVHWGKRDASDLFCEPFPGATWLLPRAAAWRPPLRKLGDFDGTSKQSLGNMLQSGGAVVASADGRNVSWASPPSYVYLHLDGGYGFHDKLFYCAAHQRLLRGVPWLLMRTDSYLVPGLFLTPPFVGELEAMFPEKDAAFHHLGRYLFHPSNAVWRSVKSYHRANLAGGPSRRRVVGIQIRVFDKKQPPQQVLDQLLSCVRDEKLLPEITTTNNDAVLLTSLSSWYYERIKIEYGGGVAGGGVHQPSHEGEQRWGDSAHDMKALGEMYLLSTCDVLVTSGFSTFGYVAQGLAGVRPWVMLRPSPWEEWKEGQAAPEPPCRRALSVEPCFHSPSYYDCAARRNVELDRVRPYIRRCVDVSWGIQLVNESSSRW